MDKSLEELLDDFDNLFKKLTNSPLKKLDDKPIFLSLNASEKEEFYFDLRMKFIELYYEYDETLGVPFEGYINSKLGWYAHHKGEDLFDDKKFLKNVKNIEELEHKEMHHSEIDDDISFDLLFGIENLSPRQKQVIEGLYVDNLSIQEIADKYNLHKDECYRHRSLGLRNLRKFLEERDA